MAVWVGFLRGINLGKRRMTMDALRACLDESGFTAIKTILASGNVRFEADGAREAVRKRLETSITEAFGFTVEAVLRGAAEIEDMLKSAPFSKLDENADCTRHVLMSEAVLPKDLQIEDRPGHTEIVRIDARDIYIVGYRQPNGRYTEGVEEVLKPFYRRMGKTHLDTMRNWNTIEKVLA